MLGNILDGIKSIANFFITVGQFIVDFISDLVYAIGLIGKTVLEIPSYLGWLPSSLMAMLTTIFSIVVIYKILGRD